jgi:hypothetical protein
METAPKSPRKRFFWFLLGLAGLVLVALGVLGYLDKSWSDSLRGHDIITSSQRDPRTGERKDTTYLEPVKKP